MTNSEIAAVLGSDKALIDKNALDVHITEIWKCHAKGEARETIACNAST